MKQNFETARVEISPGALNPPKKVFIGRAFDGAVVVGIFVMVERLDCIRIMGLSVIQKERRKGVARVLMNAAIEFCVPFGKPIYIEVDSFLSVEADSKQGPNDEQLKQFYRSLGFVPVPNHPFAWVRFPIAIPLNRAN